MAIEIEEQQDSSTNWVAIISTVVIILVLLAGVYFFFFRRPELIDVAAPGEFERIKKLSDVSFDPQSLFESEKFNMLRRMEIDTSLPEPGKDNPFKPF